MTDELKLHWCEECNKDMSLFTDENGKDCWGCDWCGWSEMLSTPQEILISTSPVEDALRTRVKVLEEALIEVLETEKERSRYYDGKGSYDGTVEKMNFSIAISKAKAALEGK